MNGPIVRAGRDRGTRLWRRLVAGTLGVLLSAITAACSVEQSLPAPFCEGGDSAMIIGQSVPTASQMLCLEPLPSGWSVTAVSVTQSRSVVTFDSDRVGSSAAELRLEASCDVAGAVSTPSDRPPAERFDRIERVRPGLRADRHYVFDGGCITWHFDFDADSSATEAIAIGDTLTLVSRDDFNDFLAETFVDREI